MKCASALRKAVDDDNSAIVKLMEADCKFILENQLTIPGFFMVENDCEIGYPTFMQYAALQGKYKALDAMIDIAETCKEAALAGENEKNILYLMIVHGNVPKKSVNKLVNALIAAKRNMNENGAFGQSLLHHAVKWCRKDIVQAILASQNLATAKDNIIGPFRMAARQACLREKRPILDAFLEAIHNEEELKQAAMESSRIVAPNVRSYIAGKLGLCRGVDQASLL